MRNTYFLVALILFIPGAARAGDVIAPPHTVPTFTNQQQLVVSVSQGGVPIQDVGTSTLAIGTPLQFDYQFTHGAEWPQAQSAPQRDGLFDSMRATDRVFLELWRGTPFTPEASLVSEWDVSGTLSGSVTASLPAAGPYFFLLDFPQYLSRDPAAECAGYGSPTEDCEPDSTLGSSLEEMRTYFSSPLETRDSRQVPYQWPVFGGIRFTDVGATVATSSAASNILFLPGIEGSRLYQTVGGTEQKVWEPTLSNSQQAVKALYMNANGSSINTIYTKTGDVIAHTQTGLPGQDSDVYQTFFDQLRMLTAGGVLKDYLVFPYDWRMSPADVVEKGTSYKDGTRYLENELLSLASTSPTGKVSIVAHSNGGLVAKALLAKLVRDGKSSSVDHVFFVDVPQLGTPETLSGMLHGDLGPQTRLGPLYISKPNARGLVENMPDGYALLPSPAYFSHVSTPVIDVSAAPNLRAASKVSGTAVSSYAELSKFLTSVNGRAKPSATDIETPNVLSTALLTSSSAMHASLDAWVPPAGVSVTQIAGWGLDTTTGVTYTEKKSFSCSLTNGCGNTTTLRHMLQKSLDGDATVVAPSETALLGADTYYLDLHAANASLKKNWDHGTVTESQPFQQLFRLLLATSSPRQLPDYVSRSMPIPNASDVRLRLRVLSPVSLDAYDAEGRHTGLVTDPQTKNQYIERQIPNSYYEEDGEGKYIGLPADSTASVTMHGLDTGTFTFEATSVAGNGNNTKTLSYQDIPVTASTTATMQIPATGISYAAFSLDANGDGTVDTIIASSTQSSSPRTYVQLIESSVNGMDLGTTTKRQLQAKFSNVEHLLLTDSKWDTADDANDRGDTKKSERIELQAIRKLDRIAIWIRIDLAASAVLDKLHLKNPLRISAQQAQTILVMANRLTELLKSD